MYVLYMTMGQGVIVWMMRGRGFQEHFGKDFIVLYIYTNEYMYQVMMIYMKVYMFDYESRGSSIDYEGGDSKSILVRISLEN
jgi:hypothetical protein